VTGKTKGRRNPAEMRGWVKGSGGMREKKAGIMTEGALKQEGNVKHITGGRRRHEMTQGKICGEVTLGECERKTLN
jgi:hypothetical protein